eukprot:1158624-Pelagomonas_calceolata.AAC.3
MRRKPTFAVRLHAYLNSEEQALNSLLFESALVSSRLDLAAKKGRRKPEKDRGKNKACRGCTERERKTRKGQGKPRLVVAA